MEEEDNTHSPQSPVNSSSPASISPTIASSASKPPPSSSSQSPSALAVHNPSVTVAVNKNGRSGGGGGRDDCWSEEATKVLIDAWGERFAEPGKGMLKQQQWREVAEIVNGSGRCKHTRTDVQCKNRIDTVKKKYKQEKAKNGPSKWAFFEKLQALIGGGKAAPVGGGGPMRWHFRKRSASETESESEPEHSAESLPPLQPPLPKRLKMGGEFGDVAEAILGFTEAYEKMETGKIKVMLELEKERLKFVKEMELQRMQFLKTQMEITQKSQEERSKTRIDDDDDRNVKNRGCDVSS